MARAYITHRSSGRVQTALYPCPGYCGTGYTVLTEVPGTGIIVLQNQQNFGYEYESVTELPEVPGIVARAYITHRSSGRVQKVLYPYPGYCGTGRTELTGVPGTGMNVLQNLQKFPVRVIPG